MRAHWPEYAMEATGLGLFMVSACSFGTLLNHPSSPLAAMLTDAVARRVLMGVAMGLTAAALIYSPWGRRSGAHLNPATTLTFWRLDKLATRDAVGYAIAHLVGGVVGVQVAALVLGGALAHPAIRYVATVPGAAGVAVAFAAELMLTCVLMGVVLYVSNTAALARFTGVAAAVLIALFISLESPLSGMSLNPARSFASAVPAAAWHAFWIYLLAPPLGMLLAAEWYVRRHGGRAVYCAKLHHGTDGDCIFRCRFGELRAASASAAIDPATQRPSI
jgi:aquaporin Z